MTQQQYVGDANHFYRKQLFIHNGSTFTEVQGRLINPYVPPTPQFKAREIQVIDAPSQLVSKRYASYKCKTGILFNQKNQFSEFVSHASGTIKFYDEKGSIYLGVIENIVPAVYEAGSRYTADVDLLLIKKDSYFNQRGHQFQDLLDINSGFPYWFANDVERMAALGIITSITRDGEYVRYFEPNRPITRAELTAFLNRTRRSIEIIIRE